MNKLSEMGEGELHAEWKLWKRRFMDYLIAVGKQEEPEATKLSILRHCIGERGRGVLAVLFPEGDSSDEEDEDEDGVADSSNVPLPITLKEVLRAIDSHCRAVKSYTPEAFKFHSRSQQEGESVKEFETELRAMVKECGYKCSSCKTRFEDRMVADRIVVGVADSTLQTKLLEMRNPTLEEVVKTCMIHEAARVNQKGMTAAVNRLEKKVDVVPVQEVVAAVNEGAAGERRTNKKCFSCGLPFDAEHKSKCPARLVTCFGCKKVGHYKRFCRQKSVKAIEWAGEGMKNSINNKMRVLRINSYRSVKEDWYHTMVIGDWPVKFKLDSGADVNCIPRDAVLKIAGKQYSSRVSKFRLEDYNGNAINNFGVINLKCFNPINKTMKAINFVIVDSDREAILGRDCSVELKLIARLNEVKIGSITKEDFVKRYAKAFSGIGKFPGQCKIELKSGSVPKLKYKKRIPLAMQDRLKSELLKMVDQGVIEKVDYPTDWINNMQIVESPDRSLRICLDPKPLNECIKREHFSIPKINELMAEVCGMEIFTVLDLKKGFWQLVLDDASSDLTTFMTPIGRFKFRRMPFGISMAPEQFQRKMFQMFGDIKGILIYFDDLCVYAKTEAEHDAILDRVLKRAIENGITFNPAKVQYRQKSIKLMGRIVEGGTIRPAEDYLAALSKMPVPKDKPAVHRLLGLFRYLSPFIPNLSEKTENLRNLIRDDVKWLWTDAHENEVGELKKIVSASPVLRVFDPNKPIKIQTDSSKDGVGSVLLQNNQPVAYASRTLSKSEQKWSQIEKELLAVVFACEKFHFYIYGQEVCVESDHKPLESIMKKDIDEVSVRLQGMLIRLLRYPLIKVNYRPGKEILIADCLSRAPLESDEDYAAGMAKSVHMVRERVCMSEKNKMDYQTTLRDDDCLLRVMEFVGQNSWPGYHKLHIEDQEMFKVKDELHVEEGMLFKDHKLVIPKRLRNSVLNWVHGSHLGIDKTVAKGTSMYFWPGMTGDLEKIVRNCYVCEKFQRHQQKETIHLEEEPLFPFYRVGIDIFEYMGKDYLSIYDAYSGYLIVEKVPEKSATQMIKNLEDTFLNYGYPVNIRADNNPFAAKAIKDFCQKRNVKIRFSSPRYPQSNGLAERGVGIAKNIMKKVIHKGWNEYKAQIQEYNTTKVVGKGASPSELFYGRQVKTRQPVHGELLKRKWISEKTMQERFKNYNEKQSWYYNRNAKDLPSLSTGDTVIFWKQGKTWIKGVVVKKKSDYSYVLRDDEGQLFHRNRRFIKKRNVYTSLDNNIASNDNETVNNSSNEHVNSGGEESVYQDALNTSSESPQVRSEVTRTRSGRTVREPGYLNDYVRH